LKNGNKTILSVILNPSKDSSSHYSTAQQGFDKLSLTRRRSSLRGTKQSPALSTSNNIGNQIASSCILTMRSWGIRINKKVAFIFYFLLFTFYFSAAHQTQVQYLSGTGSNKTVKWDFFLTEGRNSGKWTSIPVPSNWELQGFGKYNYGLDKDSAKGKEKGLYKYQFKVPASWKAKKVNIVFEGSMTDTDVKINGQSAGPTHQGAFYAFKYDISNLLKYDTYNLLEVTVAKHSANASVNAAERKGDFWVFGGIFRPVYLEALPAQNISRVALDAKANGAFKANVYVDNVKLASQVAAQVYTLDGKKVGVAFTTKVNKGDSVVQVQTIVAAPKLWSAEFPNLYRLDISLLENGKPVHTVSKRFGFRTVEVRERDGIYVNGVKIKFKGVNRHSFNPTTGRALSKAISIEDVRLMKDMNMNAVRMSHYPPDAHFLDVCDSLGLYVMDELAGWHGMYDTETGSKLVKEMIEHDVNHPSIFIWSNGNEGGHNLNLDALFTKYDIQKRAVVHPWQTFSGITTEHYREYNYGIANYMNGHDIVMPTEFLHGWFDGGHGAGLEDYWEAMWNYPLAAGGFLWDFADEGVVRTDLNGKIDTDKDHGADGIIGPFHEKEGSYYTIKEVWSPIHFERKDITDAFDGKVNIENRYNFTNINQCSFSWSLKSLLNKSMVEIKGAAVAPNLKPLEKGTLQLTLPKNWKQYDVLYVTAFGPDKKEIFAWSFPIVRPVNVVKAMVPLKADSKAQLTEEDTIYNISANGVNVRINKNNGKLISVQNSKGSIPLNNGPIIQEGANNFQNFTHHYDGDTLIIASTFDRKKSYNTLQWTIYPSGIIKMQVKYFPSEYFTWFDGVNFSFPESEMKGVEYMGNGPYRVWKNRLKGNQFGIWNKAYNKTETSEQWVYPEFKGYHSNMYWVKFNTTTQPFTVYTENEGLFFRLFTPAWKTDQWHNYETYFPTGDISFMNGIPSIGSKTQRAETTGPMGMKNIFYDYEKEPNRSLDITLYFDFSGK
jgi:beta-galactosidase/beta-glucuronidase